MDIAITLPDELVGMIRSRIAQGQYDTPSDVIAAALRHLDTAETEALDDNDLRTAWDEGIASEVAESSDFEEIRQAARSALRDRKRP